VMGAIISGLFTFVVTGVGFVAIPIMGILSMLYAGIVFKTVAAKFQQLFLKRYARAHRLFGLALLFWLALGALLLFCRSTPSGMCIYDIVLGLVSIGATVTAVQDFAVGHASVKNVASGILDEKTVVTLSEMKEHIFYQILNLAQILFLHFVRVFGEALWVRLVGVTCVTCIWLARSSFPVNAFQDNYNQGQPVWSFVSIMYRTKKYQYVFYKHAMLHGVNITIACADVADRNLAIQPYFRRYWLCLNISYVMEFFLQSLVKGRHMPQATMLFLQQLMMTTSTIAACYVLAKDVDLIFALVSVLLNFVARGSDVSNVLIAAALRFMPYAVEV